MDWQQILRIARNSGASDVHFSTGETPWLRLDGRMTRLQEVAADASVTLLEAEDIQRILSLLQVNSEFHHVDFAVTLPELGRFRVIAFLQARGPSLVF